MRKGQKSSIGSNHRFFGTLVLAGVIAGSAAGQAPFAADRDDWRAGRIEAAMMRAGLDGLANPDEQSAGAPCLDLAQISVMFAPEASAGDVRRVLERQADQQLALFQLQGSRWTSTATDGAVGQGAPLTLTYSFIADGVQISGFSGEPASPSNLQATANASFPGGFTAFKQQVRRAFDAWSAITNITYVEVSDDGATFGSTAGVLGARGDVRIGGHTVGDAILAYNFFPQFGGEMVFDTSKFDTFANSSGNFRALHNVVAHEHGHGLGLNHVIPENGTKLMEPFLNTGFEGPQEDDIRGVTRAYGDAAEANNTQAANFFVGGALNSVQQVGVQQFVLDEASLERAGQSDFYGFTCFAAVPIAIRVQPLGTVYDQGPQGGSAASVDAESVRNLGLRLWRRTSAANQTFELFAQIDFNAAGEAEYHPPLAYSVAGFMVAEVFSNDGVDDVQRYSLTISNAAIEAPVEPANMRVFEDGGEMGDSHTMLFGATVVGQTQNETIQIANDGTGVLELGVPIVQGPAAGDYSFTLLQNQVQPGGFVAMAIAFTPSQVGQRVAVISLPNNDPDRGDFSFIVSGTANGAPQLEVQIAGVVFGPGSTFDFGDVALNEVGSAEVVLRNAGTAALNVSSVSLLGAAADEYEINISSASLAPGSTATAQLSVAPSASGPRAAQLRFISNSVVTGFSINLTANGVEALVDCNGNGIDDATDIADAASADCDANGTPDECEADSDGDGVIDACDSCPNGEDQADSDGDGLNDCVDPEPTVPADPGGDDNGNGNNNGNDNDNGNNNDDNGNGNNNGNSNENGNENGNDNDGGIDPGQNDADDPNLAADANGNDNNGNDDPNLGGDANDPNLDFPGIIGDDGLVPTTLCGPGASLALMLGLFTVGTVAIPRKR